MVFDYQARIGGKLVEDGDVKNVQVVLGARQTMPELEEGLKGASAGEQRVISAVFPARASQQASRGTGGGAAPLH